jgi:hypothetical protein
MGFSEREFEVFVLLGNPAASPPWVQVAWAEVSKALDPLIRAARARPAVRTTQLTPGLGSPNQRAISFGRIGWSDDGARKWTHTKDGRLVSGAPSHFYNCEVWAPSWTVCAREVHAPDVYFAIRNEANPAAVPGQHQALCFNASCILAVASDAAAAVSEQPTRSAEALALIVQAVVRARTVRRWGSGYAYTAAINDLIVTGLFKPGPHQQIPATVSMPDGSWESF